MELWALIILLALLLFARSMEYARDDSYFWDRWVANRPEDTDESAVLRIKHLFYSGKRGWRVDFHRFDRADAVGCFHSHPALAVRVVVWGGYVEEVWKGEPCKRLCKELEEGKFSCGAVCRRAKSEFKEWLPGMIGIVRPEFIHRVNHLRGRRSYSIWIRGRVTHQIRTVGPGYEQPSHVKEAS